MKLTFVLGSEIEETDRIQLSRFRSKTKDREIKILFSTLIHNKQTISTLCRLVFEYEESSIIITQSLQRQSQN